MNGLKRHRRLPQRLDQNTAERMFAGLAAADAPPDYALVASVLAAAAAPVTGLPAPGEAAALRAYRDAKYVGAPARAGRWFQPWRTMAGRFAVVATAGTLAISGGVAAAATGTVPTRPHHATHQAPSDLALPTVMSPAALVGDFYSRAAVATSSAPSASPAVKSATRPVIRVIPADAATSTTRAGTSTTTTVVTTSGPATTSKDAPQRAVTAVEHSADPKSDSGQQKGNNGHTNGRQNGNGNDRSAKGNSGNRGNGHVNGQQGGNNGNGHGSAKGDDGHGRGNAKGQQSGNRGNGHAKGQQNGNGSSAKGDNGHGHGNAANNPGRGHQKSGNGQG